MEAEKANKANVVKDLQSIIAVSKRLLRLVERGEAELYLSHENFLDKTEEEMYDFVADIIGR